MQARLMRSWVNLDARRFRTVIDGDPVALHTIRNRSGMAASITNYGARIEQLLVPGRNGQFADVVQGYESIEQVMTGQASMGAFIGRFANRIANGRFNLDGTDHQVTINGGAHSLHGGEKGSRFRVFTARQLSPSSVAMSYVFRDGEENFPGTLPLRVVYSVTDDDALVIDFAAAAVDKATIANFTSHAFFNLSGDLGASIRDHVLTIEADKFLELDATSIPTGRLREVAGTPLDFRTPTPIGARIDQDHDQLRIVGGYDHTYVPSRSGEGGVQRVATVHEPVSGRTMEVWSAEPALQFYSCNGLDGRAPRDVGKGDTRYVCRSAFCLEPQGYPDAPNHPEFPSAVLRSGEWRAGQIVYRFSTQVRTADA
jgi:aldose 1-epimerase